MEDVENRATKRLNIVLWHAVVCPDGSGHRAAAWKTRLANTIGVKNSTISNLCAEARGQPRKGVGQSTKKKLAGLDDETFANALGFRFETPDRLAAGRPGKDRLLKEFFNADSIDDYRLVCLHADVLMEKEHHQRALNRQAEEKKKEQDRDARWRTQDNAYWWQRSSPADVGTVDHNVPMHRCEEDAVKGLFQMLVGDVSTSTATTLYAFPHSGVSYAIERLLPRQRQFGTYYAGGIHHLHMDALSYPWDARKTLRKILTGMALRELDADSVIPPDPSLATKLALHLHQQYQLLVIHGATAIPEGNYRFFGTLADELVRIAREKRYSPVS